MSDRVAAIEVYLVDPARTAPTSEHFAMEKNSISRATSYANRMGPSIRETIAPSQSVSLPRKGLRAGERPTESWLPERRPKSSMTCWPAS